MAESPDELRALLPVSSASRDVSPRVCGIRCLSTAVLARILTISSSFSEGWDIGILLVAMPSLIAEFQLTSLELAMVLVLPNLGAQVGGVFSGFLMDAIGRLPCIAISYALCVCGCLGISTSGSALGLGLWRLLVLFGIKIGVIAVSVYMTELSPAKRRGGFVALEELNINIGLFCCTFLAWQAKMRFVMSWRILAACGAIVPGLLLILVLLSNLPESPRYLHIRGRRAEAIATLKSALEDEEEVANTLQLWRESEHMENANETWSEYSEAVGDIVHHPGFQLAAWCWFANSCSGIYVVSLFFTLFLRKAGVAEEDALAWYSLCACLKSLAVLPSCLWLMDAYGRQPLFIASALCCAGFLFTCLLQVRAGGDTHVLVWSLIGFNVSYSVGYGSCKWPYCLEVLPRQRGRAGGLFTVPAELLVSFVTAFSSIYSGTPSLVFGLLTFSNLWAAYFFWRCCPETSGTILERAQDQALQHTKESKKDAASCR